MSETFTCEHCGGEFIQTESDEEMLEEMMDLFPGSDGDTERVMVCDSCWRMLMDKLKETTGHE